MLYTNKGEWRNIETADEILKEQSRFYKELYDVDKNVHFNMTNTHGVIVPEELQQIQNTQITMEDLGGAAKTMNNNKTPGLDRIPVDFYKVFWHKLKHDFYNMALEAYKKTNYIQQPDKAY